MTTIKSVLRYRGSKQSSQCMQHVGCESDDTVSVPISLNDIVMHLLFKDKSAGDQFLYFNRDKLARASIINYQTSLLQNHNSHLTVSLHHHHPIHLSSLLILLPSPIPVLRTMLTNSILSRIRNLILQNLDKLVENHCNNSSQRRTYGACQ